MEERLRAYMDGLFRGMPDTAQAREIKEEILQNITDKYHDLVAEGKSEEAAYNIAIEGIGDLGEVMDSLREGAGDEKTAAAPEDGRTSDSAGTYGDYQGTYSGGSQTQGSYADGASPGMSSRDREEYREWKNKSAVRTAIAVMLYILCVVPLIICDELGLPDGLGAGMLFVFVAVATAILIINNMTKPDGMKKDNAGAGEVGKGTAKGQSWKSICSAIWTLTLVLYFVISFMTMAWYITWVIFLIAAAVQSILKAVYFSGDGAPSGTAVRIICAVLGAVALIVFILYIVFRVLSGNFPSFFSIVGGTHYDNSEKYTAGNVSLQPDRQRENPLSEIHVDWIAGSVEIVPVKELENIEIVEKNTDQLAEEDRVHSYYHDGILDIQYEKSGVYFFKSRNITKELLVRIPMELAQNLEVVEGDLVSAGMKIGDVQVGTLNVDTVSGDTVFSGSVSREIEIDSTSGNATLTLAGVPSELSADTVSGDVTLILPSTSSFTAELDSVSGEISCNMPNMQSQSGKKGNSHIQCGSQPDKEFEFDSVSGDVFIQPAA